jgi:hypothetical protein
LSEGKVLKSQLIVVAFTVVFFSFFLHADDDVDAGGAVCMTCESEVKESGPIKFIKSILSTIAPKDAYESASSEVRDVPALKPPTDLVGSYFLDPALIEQMDSRKLAEMIVARLNEVCCKVRDPSMQVPTDDFSEIMMMVPKKHLASIAKYGFKNQHQTSGTGGCDCKSNRLATEMRHVEMGLPYTNKTRELLPKYAMQVFKGEAMGQFSIANEYGDTIIHFKPEVKKRATWSDRDSLAIHETLRTNQIRPKKDTGCGFYCEAQIWGELDLTDVDYIAVPEGTEITAELKSLGKKILTFTETADHKSSLRIHMNETPAYTPESQEKQMAPLNIKAIDERLSDPNASPIEKSFLKSMRWQQMPKEDLIREYSKADNTARPRNYKDSDFMGTDKTRVLAELTKFSNDPKVAELLEKEFKESTDKTARTIALSGLANLDVGKLRELLASALKSPDKAYYDDDNTLLKRLATFISLKNKVDPEIKTLLDELGETYTKTADTDNFACNKETF